MNASGNTTVIVLVLLDLLGVVLIFNLNHFLITDSLATNFLLTWKLVLIAAFTFLYFYLMDLYNFESILTQLGMLERSFIAMVLTGITVALTVYLLGPTFIGGFVGRGVLAASLLMVWLWALGWRYLLNHWIRSQRRMIEWLVITNGDTADFVKHFRSFYAVERLLLLAPPESAPEAFADPAIETPGTWHDLEQVLWERQVSGIIVMAPENAPEMLISRLMGIRISGVRIYTINDFYERFLARLPVFQLDQRWIATAHGFDLIHNPIGLRFKRYIDILIALVGGLLLLPLILLTALAVLITSGRPVLYRQTRVGENGTPFTLIKFRTMINNAEARGAQFAAKNDPRTTLLGGIMRKFRLDELPQLWNVLCGDMSFIGPRPERPEFISQLSRDIPYYSLRHVVRPGITGWAQVMHGYGDSSEDAAQKLQYDLFYIKNYSLMLDISIIIRSIKVVFFGTGR
ncbi:MAG: exopolysaccharide biosynthesis polyprenyl glycosylphosphotransferase [Pseudomonadota bacterium]